ncbi:MAG: hypothetical protein ACLTDR_06765 [Adlercreutzia equolifaciens]
MSEVLAALPTPGPRDVAWNPEAAEQEREAVAAVKKALEEAGESVSPSENAESNKTEEDVAVGGDLGRSSSAGTWMRLERAFSWPTCARTWPHRLLAGLRAPGCAGHRHGCRTGGGGARQKENTEASGASLDPRGRAAVLALGSGIGEKRMGTFDAVVSNPPYVPTAVMAGIPARGWPISSRRSPWTGAPTGSICSGRSPSGPPGP